MAVSAGIIMLMVEEENENVKIINRVCRLCDRKPLCISYHVRGEKW